MNTQTRMNAIVIRERRHVLAGELQLHCPYANRHLLCRWSTGTDCMATTEYAKDCPLNNLDDAAACEEAERA
jgi:hypothetical protein